MIPKKDIAGNCARWMQVMKQELESGHNADIRTHLAGIFIFCDRRDPEGSAAICANVNAEAVVAMCRGILKKLGRDPASMIIDPYGRNN